MLTEIVRCSQNIDFWVEMQFKFTIYKHCSVCLDKTIYNSVLNYGNQPSLKSFLGNVYNIDQEKRVFGLQRGDTCR